MTGCARYAIATSGSLRSKSSEIIRSESFFGSSVMLRGPTAAESPRVLRARQGAGPLLWTST